MTLALIAFAVMTRPSIQAPQAPTQAYTDNKLGLSFTHPTTWILENPNAPAPGKKGRRRKVINDTVHFRIPLTGAVDDADLIIMRAEFSGSPETWQKVQVDANADLKRTVERQWQQEILGVPLLLTRIAYSEGGTAKTTLTGLLYNDAPSKLLFRLTGPAGDFDKAQFQFTEAMQTLRTTNNALPKAQDPDHPSTAAPVVSDRGAKHTLFAPAKPPKPVLAPVAIPMVVSTKNVILRVPKGWRAEHIDGSTLELRGPDVPYPLRVRLYSVLDSDPPAVALSKATAASLANFSTVETRHDTPVDANQADCVVTSVWRTGTGAKGKLLSYDAVGRSGDFYFVASATPTGENLDVQKKSLQKLLDLISIDTAS